MKSTVKKLIVCSVTFFGIGSSTLDADEGGGTNCAQVQTSVFQIIQSLLKLSSDLSESQATIAVQYDQMQGWSAPGISNKLTYFNSIVQHNSEIQSYIKKYEDEVKYLLKSGCFTSVSQ